MLTCRQCRNDVSTTVNGLCDACIAKALRNAVNIENIDVWDGDVEWVTTNKRTSLDRPIQVKKPVAKVNPTATILGIIRNKDFFAEEVTHYKLSKPLIISMDEDFDGKKITTEIPAYYLIIGEKKISKVTVVLPSNKSGQITGREIDYDRGKPDEKLLEELGFELKGELIPRGENPDGELIAYMEKTSGSHNKFYEIKLYAPDQGPNSATNQQWLMAGKYGAIGSKGQNHYEYYSSRSRARTQAIQKRNAKVAKGYRIMRC